MASAKTRKKQELEIVVDVVTLQDKDGKKVETIDEKKVTIYEMKVKAIRKFIKEYFKMGTDDFNQEELFNAIIPNCSNLSIVEFDELTFSELDTIWKVFKEVNKGFLQTTSRLGLNGAIMKLKDQWITKLQTITEESGQTEKSTMEMSGKLDQSEDTKTSIELNNKIEAQQKLAMDQNKKAKIA